MSYKKHFEVLLAKKEDEINLLDSRVQTYIARTSHLQARLLSTLDAFDALQAAHAREVDALSQDKDRLKTKLHRYAEVVRAAEEERDDMRDAVLKLIEKVEMSNDYSKWPHSQMFMSSLADIPIKPRPLLAHQPPPSPDTEDLLSYAVAMLETVHRERDAEKHAHERTREVLESHILLLEAKLSRREAELEACAASPGHGLSIRSPSPATNDVARGKRRNDRQDERRDISSEEIIGMLDVTAARNKLLEAEIKILSRRLEQARAAASTPVPAPSTSTITRSAPMSSISVPPAPSTTQRQSHHPSQPKPPYPNHHTHSFQGDDESQAPEQREHPFKALERQIRDLSSKIDGFAQERRTILGGMGLEGGLPVVSRDPHGTSAQLDPTREGEVGTRKLESPPQAHRQNVRMRTEASQPPEDDWDHDHGLHSRLHQLEDECASLRTSEARLMDQLHAMQIAALRREEELEAEVEGLRMVLDSRVQVASSHDRQREEIPPLSAPSACLSTLPIPQEPAPGDPPPSQSNQTGHVQVSTKIPRQLLPPSSPSIVPSTSTIQPPLTAGASPHPIQSHQSCNQRDNSTSAYLNPHRAINASAGDHRHPPARRRQYPPSRHHDEHPFLDRHQLPSTNGLSNQTFEPYPNTNRTTNTAPEPPVILHGNDEPNPHPKQVRRHSDAQNLLDDRLTDGEMSMELATPLLLASVISISQNWSPPLASPLAASSQSLSPVVVGAEGGLGGPSSALSPLFPVPSLPLPVEDGDHLHVDVQHRIIDGAAHHRVDQQIDEEREDHDVEIEFRAEEEHDQEDLPRSPAPSLGTNASSPHSVTASMPLDDPFVVPPGSRLDPTSTPHTRSRTGFHHNHHHHHSNPFDLGVDHQHPDVDGPPGYEYEHSFDDTHHSFDLRSDEGSPTLSQMMLSAAASASSSAGLRSGTHSGTNHPDSLRSPAHALGVLHPAQTSPVNGRTTVRPEDLTSVLERVEAELLSTQTEIEVGEDVLAHLEELVSELRRREREEAEEEEGRPPSS